MTGVIATIIGVIAVGCMIAGARMLSRRRVDDVMAVADAVQAPRRLCPPPRGPEDDPDFMNSLRGPQ